MTAAVIDADEMCVAAGRVVTRAYRVGDPQAREVDAAHGRVWARTRGRGSVPVDDPDVATILDARVRVDARDRAEARARWEQREPSPMLAHIRADTSNGDTDTSADAADLAAVLEARPSWPTIGAVRAGRGAA